MPACSRWRVCDLVSPGTHLSWSCTDGQNRCPRWASTSPISQGSQPELLVPPVPLNSALQNVGPESASYAEGVNKAIGSLVVRALGESPRRVPADLSACVCVRWLKAELWTSACKDTAGPQLPGRLESSRGQAQSDPIGTPAALQTSGWLVLPPLGSPSQSQWGWGEGQHQAWPWSPHHTHTQSQHVPNTQQTPPRPRAWPGPSGHGEGTCRPGRGHSTTGGSSGRGPGRTAPVHGSRHFRVKERSTDPGEVHPVGPP